MISEYKLDDKYVNSLKLKYSKVAISLWVLVLLLAELSSQWWQEGGKDMSPLFSFIGDAIIVIIACILTIIIIFKSVKSRLSGFKVVMDDQTIYLQNLIRPLSKINITDIKAIFKTYPGDLILFEKNGKALNIPHDLTDFHYLETTLKKSVPIFKEGPYTFYQKNNGSIAFIFMGLCLIIFSLQNKTAIFFLSILLLISVGYKFWELRKRLQFLGVPTYKNYLIGYIALIGFITVICGQKLLEK